MIGRISLWSTSCSHNPFLVGLCLSLRPYSHAQTVHHNPLFTQERNVVLSSRKLNKCQNFKAYIRGKACHITKLLFSSRSRQEVSSVTLPGKVDRYQGVWVDLSKPDDGGLNLDELSETDFDNLLKASLLVWRTQGITSVWLHVALSQGSFLTVASRYGFSYHHAEGEQATLVLWLPTEQESKIPIFATHQVGVSGLVINESTWEVLVVQDKNRPFQIWKFPGGLSNLGENIAMTAEREVFEETGLKTEFQSVLAFRQHHHLPGAFGRSDLYVLCRLKPLTFDLQPCQDEIAACKWMPVEALRSEVHASSMTHKLADLVLFGLRNGFQSVDITSCEMASLHKGLKFHLFHRPIQ